MRAVAIGAVGVLAAGVVLSAAAASAADGWNGLTQAAAAPKLEHEARCPVSRVDTRVAWRRVNIFGGSGIGRGPVYPGLGSRNGLLSATRDEQYGGPWFGEKVFWYVLPSYRWPVLICGRRLDGSQMIGFNGMKQPNRELRISPLETVGWSGQPRGSRGIPSGVRVLTAGCYGFQIDGTNFSRIVVAGSTSRASRPAPPCQVTAA